MEVHVNGDAGLRSLMMKQLAFGDRLMLKLGTLELYAGNRRWIDEGDVFAMKRPEDLEGFLETVRSR
jgi:hypothetical protein